MALARRSRRRTIVFLSLMGAATLTPLFSHIEARFLYAPFVLGLAISAGGWGWVAARLAAADSPAGRALSTCVHLALAFGVVATGVRHPDGAVDPLARTALHREIAAQVAQVAGEGPVLAIQMNAPFWAGRAYRALPIGPPQVVLDYARAQGASCLVLEGEHDLARRPELAPLVQDPPPAGFEQALVRPSLEGGELRVFRIGSAQGSERAIVPESGGSPDVMTRHAR
jgi:hypothetical protein